VRFTGPITLGANTTLSSKGALTLLEGALGEAGGARSLTVSGTGGLVIAGNSTYSGGTQVLSSALFFRQAGSVPALGTISSDALGYIGAGFTSGIASGFIARFAPATTAGTIGLDTDPAAPSANIIAEPINLGAFNPLARLGSATRATLSATATIKPAPGGRYAVDVQNAAGTAGVGWDSTLVTGTLNFTATLGSPFPIFLRSLDGAGAAGAALNFNPYTDYSWTILSATTLSGFSAAAVTLDPAGFLSPVNGGTFSLGTVGNSLAVNFTPVPEPETWALPGELHQRSSVAPPSMS
jgi:autotransporter-associated beta strand protein